MYELRFTDTFKSSLHTYKPYQLKIADAIKLLFINPFDKRLKTYVAKDPEFFGCYKSESKDKICLYWRFGTGQIIYLLGIRMNK